MMHCARGPVAGAEQLQKENLMCRGLVLRAKDMLSFTEGAQLPPAPFHDPPGSHMSQQQQMLPGTRR